MSAPTPALSASSNRRAARPARARAARSALDDLALEHGVVTGEVMGLEVARVIDDDQGYARGAVAVLRHMLVIHAGLGQEAGRRGLARGDAAGESHCKHATSYRTSLIFCGSPQTTR